MPQWKNTPPAEPEGYALRIVRTPANKPLTGIVTSLEVIGCCTHYAGNRTVPCEGPEACQLCQEGYSWRWHGYLACVLTSTLEHVLFEFTATASDTFKNYELLHHTMRGCHFQAARPSGRNNGRVVLACKPYDQSRLRLPEPPDVKAALCHIWNVQQTRAKTQLDPARPGRQIGAMPDAGQNHRHAQT
jgi:hypothetical protein